MDFYFPDIQSSIIYMDASYTETADTALHSQHNNFISYVQAVPLVMNSYIPGNTSQCKFLFP